MPETSGSPRAPLRRSRRTRCEGDERTLAGRLEPELRALVERSAALPRGLAFVRRGPVECVAAALGAHPRLVERLRRSLEEPEQRALAIAAFSRARGAPRTSLEREPGLSPVCDPARLAAEAERHPLGIQFLLCAPLENAAIAFGAHPEVVAGARRILAARGVEPMREADES